MNNISVKVWLWSVTKENWEILKNKQVWASKNTGKIKTIIHPNDKIIFYVKGTKEIQGIFIIKSKWYNVNTPTWYKEKKSTRYPSQIKIKPEIISRVRLDTVIDKLKIFKTKLQKSGKLSWDQSMVLKPRSGGYPSNNGEPIPHQDYLTIRKIMQGNTKKKIGKLQVSHIPVDRDGIPGKKTGTVIRYIRDTKKSRKLKQRYRNRCQVCNYRLDISPGKSYSEVHHIFPLKKGGPDNFGNMVVLCARCHAEFDYRVKGISYDGIHVINKNGRKMRKLRRYKDHVLDLQNLLHQ